MPRDPWLEFTNGATPLHAACLGPFQNKEAKIASLLREGYSVKKKDTKGCTPLHHLCFSARHVAEFKGCTSQLLQARADVNARDRSGRTPLMDLCGNEFVLPEMLSHLLQLGADVKLKTRKQISALHELCSNNSLPPARILLDAKAEINAMCSKGMTPLHSLCGTLGWIVCRDGVTNIHELLEARADASMLDLEARSPAAILCSQFYKRDTLVLYGFHGPLCPEPLDAALKPLLLAEAQSLKETSFEKKVEWFRGVLEYLLMYAPIADEYEALPLLQVDRKQVLQSICQQLERLTPHMEDVMFGQETGQGAGLVRDLFSVFSTELSKEDYNLFVVTDTEPPRLALSPRPCFNELRSSYYKLVGKMMSLALLKEQHLPVRFAKPLLKELLGMDLSPDDLADVDRGLFKRLNHLRSLDEEAIKGLDLDFSLDEVHFGKRRKVSLTWNGENMPVTKSNIELYVNLYAAHRLRSNEEALSSLKSGFYFFCPQALIQAASTCLKLADFDCLLCGNDEIDANDWKRNTRYEGPGAAERTNVVKWFWDAVSAMTNQERKLLLRFATGQSSSPIGGFKQLKSQEMSMPFTIVLKSKPEEKNLRSFYPTAATCSNLLQLPRYKSEADLKKYLGLVVQEEMMTFAELEWMHGKGFLVHSSMPGLRKVTKINLTLTQVRVFTRFTHRWCSGSTPWE